MDRGTKNRLDRSEARKNRRNNRNRLFARLIDRMHELLDIEPRA